jgi:MoaA/NifB/PqqE/SkfB family radical SAM enzyme
MHAANKLRNGVRATRCWVLPYVKSRIYSKRFRPLLSYLFTEWKCNIDCHYCFQFDNKRQGMSWETAKRSIDWLHSTGCRVLALMGGEPLLRKDFILKVIGYASKKGFFVYLPTNGYLMTPDFIDRAGKAGVAAVNLAVDVVRAKPGLPKALMSVKRNFDYLVSQQKKYGYIIFFNINITRKNLDDVRQLSEIAHRHKIGMDYHIAEPPLIEHGYYRHKDDGLWVDREHWKQFDELIDWIVLKNRQGYTMVNSVEHLLDMKKFIRGAHKPWSCRAGHNGSFIRADGRISPCFEMQDSGVDFGSVGNPKFDRKQLAEMKQECEKHCLSTCFCTMSSYYRGIGAVVDLMLKHVRVGSRQ